MPKRRLILAILALGILAALIGAFTRPREPSYKGIPLSKWLDRLSEFEPDEATPQAYETREAIRKLGTNAVPWLLNAVRYEDPRWLKPLVHQMNRMGIHDSRLNDFSCTRYARAFQAVDGFRVLGPQARSAIPELLTLLRVAKREEDVRKSGGALARIGQPAVHPLLMELTNAPPGLRLAIISTLGWAGTNAAPAVPVLIQYAQPKDARLSEESIRALGNIHSEPTIVLPILANALRDQDSPYTAVQALMQYGEKARPYASLLFPILEDPDDYVRTAATNALLNIAPDLLTNAPPK